MVWKLHRYPKFKNYLFVSSKTLGTFMEFWLVGSKLVGSVQTCQPIIYLQLHSIFLSVLLVLLALSVFAPRGFRTSLVVAPRGVAVTGKLVGQVRSRLTKKISSQWLGSKKKQAGRGQWTVTYKGTQSFQLSYTLAQKTRVDLMNFNIVCFNQ